MPRPMLLRGSAPITIACAVLACCLFATSQAHAQGFPATAIVSPEDLRRCEALERVLTEQLEMKAEISPDSLDDWRTKRNLPACRVTAAGSMVTAAPGDENLVFYQILVAAGWERTPDPRDRPNEAAIRLRFDGTDCFFTPYFGIRLFTQAEFRVNKAYGAPEGETRFNYLAVCVEALPSVPL